MSDPTEPYELREAQPSPPRQPINPALTPQTLGYAGAGVMPVYDNHERARLAKLFITIYAWTYVVNTLLSIPMTIASIVFLNDINAVIEEGPASASFGLFIGIGCVLAVIGLVAMVIFVLGTVFYMMWQYRTVWNLRAVGRTTKHTPGWSVGWWFVPVANLFVPKRILSDIWTLSGAEARSHTNRGGMLYTYWITGILLSIAGTIVSSVGEVQNMDQPVASPGFLIVSSIFNIASAILFIFFYFGMAKFISEVQSEQPAANLA
jgi:hypothetical protein